MQVPGLLIGVGATGVRIVQRVYDVWWQAFGTAPDNRHLLGIGFEECPEHFPQGAYFQLSHDPQSIIAQVQDEQDTLPHLLSWFDVDRGYSTGVRDIPRVVERILFVQDIARGDDSALFRGMRGRLLQMGGTRAPNIVLVGSINEPAANSLLVDMSHLCRQLVATQTSATTDATIHAYTLLPDDKPTTAAALQEILRLTRAVDPTYGYPLHYRRPDDVGSSRLWAGSLQTAPFDYWSVYDTGGKNTEQIVAASIFAHLQDRLRERLAADYANMDNAHAMPPLNTGTKDVLVTTENAFVMLMPDHYIEQYWCKELARQALTSEVAAGSTDRTAQLAGFVETFPTPKRNILPLLLEADDTRRQQRLDARTAPGASWDDVLFPVTVTVRAEGNLRNNQSISGLPTNTAEQIRQSMGTIADYVEEFRVDAPDENSYARFLDQVRRSLLESFAKGLQKALYAPLVEVVGEGSSLGASLALAEAVLERTHAARLSTAQYETAAVQDYEARAEDANRLLARHKQSVEVLLNQRVAPMTRLVNLNRPSAALVQAYDAYAAAAARRLDLTRARQQAAVLHRMAADMQREAETHVERLRAWAVILAKAAETIAAEQQALPKAHSQPNLRYAIENPLHPWIARRLAEQAPPGLRWTWDAEGNALVVRVNNVTFTLDHNRMATTLANNTTEAVTVPVRERLKAATLLHYVEEQVGEHGEAALDAIAAQTTAAEEQTLTLAHKLGDSRRFTRGYLLLPAAQSEHLDVPVEGVQRRLKQRHQEDRDSDQRIAPVWTTMDAPLAYLYALQRIDFWQEATVAKAMHRAYWQHVSPQDHIFAADQVGLAISLWMRDEYDPAYELNPVVSSGLLHAPQDVTWLFVGYALRRVPALALLDVAPGEGGALLDGFRQVVYNRERAKIIDEVRVRFHQHVRAGLENPDARPDMDGELSWLFERTQQQERRPQRKDQMLQQIIECANLKAHCEWLRQRRDAPATSGALWFDIHTVGYYLVQQLARQQRQIIKGYRSQQSTLTWKRQR